MTKKAYQSFAAQGKSGEVIVISEDDLYADDHPFVKRWPDHFGNVEDVMTVHQDPARVEAATAEPGEKRAAKRS